MPNWCQNEVTVTGDEKEIARFKELVKWDLKDHDFSFHEIIPMPDDIYNEMQNPPGSDAYTDRWYNWSIENWGVKWDLLNEDMNSLVEEDYELLVYHFDTAWSPPALIYLKLVELFPELNVSWFYREEGMGMAGYLENDDHDDLVASNEALVGLIKGDFKLTVTDPPSKINATLVD